MKRYVTKDLNRAAYLIYLGAIFIDVVGNIGTAQFFLYVSKEAFRDESEKKEVDYKKYMKIRQRLKEQQRINLGLPARYSNSKPFILKDLARII